MGIILNIIIENEPRRNVPFIGNSISISDVLHRKERIQYVSKAMFNGKQSSKGGKFYSAFGGGEIW